MGEACSRSIRTSPSVIFFDVGSLTIQGLQTYGKSAQSWERALSLVASDDNPANAKLREEYQKNLAQAQRLARKHGQAAQHGMAGLPNVLLMNSIGKKHPWDRAREMIPRLRRQGITKSSVRISSDVRFLGSADSGPRHL